MGTAGAEQLRQRLAQGLAARPVLREALRALGAGGFSLVLAGAGLLSAHVPLALAPVCVLPFGPAAVCAYLGAVAGYAVFWGLSAALEPVAAGFLMLAGEEMEEAKRAVALLGGMIEQVYEYPIQDALHKAVVIRKIRPTPTKYPRAFAKIKKSPL